MLDKQQGLWPVYHNIQYIFKEFLEITGKKAKL